ncbi:MAG: D-2-hydroxyacid dehydrogenase [Chloroflexi bacterium]|nr:D-2-hydroxyacid dehydrogenase [Chloroflexota bacterium]
MTDKLTIMIASQLEPEHIERIRAVDPRIEVLYDLALVPQMRYIADHTGGPFQRTPEQQAQWLDWLKRAEVLFDFERAALKDLPVTGPRVKWIQWTSAGIGQVIKGAGIDRLPIAHTTASGVHARPLADFCLMVMLMTVKNFLWMQRDKRAHHWERYCGEELTGKTLAIVGMGRVGSEVARTGKLMGMCVIGMRRGTEPAPYVDRMVTRAELPDMLRVADFVVLIAPHTPETENLIGGTELAQMKPTAVLINIARGQLVDDAALVRALQSGQIAGAAIDVARVEPLDPASPLWAMPNVVISPHSASTVTAENDRIMDIFCENIGHYLRGEPMRNRWNPDLLY